MIGQVGQACQSSCKRNSDVRFSSGDGLRAKNQNTMAEAAMRKNTVATAKPSVCCESTAMASMTVYAPKNSAIDKRKQSSSVILGSRTHREVSSKPSKRMPSVTAMVLPVKSPSRSAPF